MKVAEYLQLIKGETKLPKDLFADEDLSPEAKLVYAGLQGVKQRGMHIEDKELAGLLNLSTEQLNECRQELEQSKWGDDLNAADSRAE